MAVVAEGNDYIKVGLCRGHAREGLAVPMLKMIARAKCARNRRLDFNFVACAPPADINPPPVLMHHVADYDDRGIE